MIAKEYSGYSHFNCTQEKDVVVVELLGVVLFDLYIKSYNYTYYVAFFLFLLS